jgi:nitrate reductase NapAB chaperone NapD
MAKNPCKYLIEINKGEFKEFTEAELKDYLLGQDLSKLKPIQNAIQERTAEEEIPRIAGTRKNITEGGEGVRPSKQRTKITAESKGDEEAVRMRSLYKQVITRSTGLTEEQKSILKNDPNALYTVLPAAESKRIALELIQEMGVAEAVAEASSSTTTLQPVERTMILGAAMDYYAKLGKEKLNDGDMPSAQAAARKEIDANEELRRVASTLGQLGTDYGRAINAFKEIYKLSSLALERKLVKDVEELNEEREEGATEDAKQIKKIITEDASDIEDVADELTNEEVESKLDAAKKVSDLEKQVENLRREILERDKAQKGTKKNPLRIKRITNDTEYDKRLKDFKQRARSVASKDDLVDLTYFGLYHIENGITKFADWYKEMSKNFKGFRSQFKNIYNSVAEKAAENGADRNMFDNDETIQSVLDDFQQETDAKKIVQATKKVAQAKLKREEENNPERAVKIAPSLAAERIRKDAEKNLDMPSTEVEQTYLKRLVKVINSKAKEYYAQKKENISNVNDVLAFAIANGKKDYAIWKRTQAELENQIDEDENLTEDEKEEVKDFLQNYRESIFDTLLTKNQISEAVREKLIENGYFVERIVKGTPVKSVDWSKITGNATTLKEAKEKIVKSITDLGFTEAQAKGEINAILDYFDAKISEKKTAEINKYLQKGILNKVKALGKKKVKRNSVDKLVELNKKGLLDDAKIKEILAAELGLMEITSDDLKNLREWSSKVDDENTPIFIRKEFEEKIQYLFDTKSGNINYLENRSASMANRLSSVVNQVVNLLGGLRAVSTLETVAIKTGKPVQALRVFLKELINATQEAKTIMKGRVSRGSSFDDVIGTTSGQPRVRYLEQGKGKFLGGKALGKPIYVQIGGNKVDLNPINFGYSKIKYIPRLLESADTIASGAVSGVTQFRIATKEINRYYPELSAAQRSQKIYDILYTVDRAVETPKAIKDLKNAGVTNPTQAEINRTINERVERARPQRLQQELYQAVKSLNLVSETKLKSDGIANPTEDEILAQSYKTLGATQAADLVARGERQAARETGKMTTRGIASFILLPVDMVQKSLNSGLKSNSKAVTTLSEIGDVGFSVLMPFANSIARWAEMTAELFAPYGISKGAFYKIGAKFTSKKSKISAEEYSDLGDDYLIRATVGLARTLLIMYALGMLNKAEDDEQEELGKSFTGTVKEKQYAQEKVQSVGKPKQSVNILGTNVSLAFLGTQGLAIGMYADFLKLRSKRKLDENMTERGELFISSLAAMEAFGGFMFDATYLSTAKKYGSAASSLIEMKEEGYAPTAGRFAGGIISSQIPFNRLQVEAATLFNPKSQSSKDFGSNLLAQMSITRAFQSGKPNFDYRGREYDYGDIYANSADGIRKMFGKAKYGDEIDAFLSEINFAATDAYRETRDEDNYKFSIINSDYTHRFMTNEEYYEFKKKTANKFNEYIKEDYKDIKDEVVDEGSLADVQKQIVSQLLSDAKSNAFIEIQEATGFYDAQYLRQLAKEKEKAQKVISKIKKYYKK